ncbi:MAG TPA: dodecin family protein [Chitinophagaceae bacterium]|nr:dodecin family protein [Chitinophagaceae bacterium]
MPIVKVIEVIASSDTSFDDAVKEAVNETAKTVRNIDSVWVKDMKVHVKDGEIKSYGVICKVSFRVDNEKEAKKEKKDKKKKKDKEK